MTLSELVAITGMPGIFKVTGKRNDGLIVTSLLDNKTTFVSGRTHMFTTLDNITLYTSGDGITLKEVLTEMKKQEEKNPPVSGKDDAALKTYIESIIPDYDKEKVYVSDMKKLIKWYELLNSNKLVEELIKEEEETAEVAAETTEGATDKKAAKKDAKKEDASKPKKEVKHKVEKTVKPASKPAPAAKKITTPRKAS